MNKKSIIILRVFIILALAGLIAWIFYFLYQIGSEESYSQNSQSGLKVYQNPEYGFEISYPENLIATTTFQSYYHLNSDWRADAFPETSGKGIVSIPVYRIENRGKNGEFVSYPMYFDAELRIGASSDPKDLEACLSAYNETATGTEIIKGITFSKFIIQNAGMMQYVQGVSYRTIHNNVCFALEQLKTGSSYRDVPNPNDIPDSVLDSYYNQIPSIIKTFEFE